MTITSRGFAPTLSAGRYIQQLVKHWGHKFATSYADGVGIVPFHETANARFEAAEDGVHIILQTRGEDEDVRMRGVIERHLDRFAFREAPLAYRWENRA
jgi:uncharacterized protein